MLIPLSNSVQMAEIDETDFYTTFVMTHWKSGNTLEVRPCDLTWAIGTHKYPTAHKEIKGITYNCCLHMLLMGRKPGFIIDHIDQNKLNNKRGNLQYVTASQNNFNQKSRPGTSVYKGVSFHKYKKKYVAKIKHNNVQQHLGYFNDQTEAANAYDTALRQIYPDAPVGAFNNP